MKKLPIIMGSICSSNKAETVLQPPQDLSELLQQNSKSPTSWLSKFQTYCSEQDLRTGVVWREQLLLFVVEVRSVISLHKSPSTTVDKEDKLRSQLLALQATFLPEEGGGLALADIGLRERLVAGLVEYRGQVQGAQGTRNALRGRLVSTGEVVGLLQEAYLDLNVWDRMDKVYNRFIKTVMCSPALAVLLSIL